jgi:hypothetical protein
MNYPRVLGPMHQSDRRSSQSVNIAGLDLRNGESLLIRDDDVPIIARREFELNPESRLEVQIEDTTWGSTIRVDPHIIPHLDGTLVTSTCHKIRGGTSADCTTLEK